MKLFAYLALFGLASTQELPPMGLGLEDFEEEETQNLLDFSMTEWDLERINDKLMAREKAWIAAMNEIRQDDSQPPMPMSMQQNDPHYYRPPLSTAGVFRKIFLENVNPRELMERYGPVIGRIIRSKEFNDLKYQLSVVESIPFQKQIGQFGQDFYQTFRDNAEALEKNVGWTRPGPVGKKEMSTEDRKLLSVLKQHLDNQMLDDIVHKNIKQHFESLQEEKKSFYRLLHNEKKNFERGEGTLKDVLKADAFLRWTPDVQKMNGMIADDLNIHNEKEFIKAINGVVSRVEKKFEQSLLFQKLRKASDDLVREFCYRLYISDIPDASYKYLVDNASKRLYSTIKSDTPNQGLESIIDEILEDMMRELAYFIKNVDEFQQSFKPAI